MKARDRIILKKRGYGRLTKSGFGAVNIYPRTVEQLHKLRERTGHPMARLVELAVDELEKRLEVT